MITHWNESIGASEIAKVSSATTLAAQAGSKRVRRNEFRTLTERLRRLLKSSQNANFFRPRCTYLIAPAEYLGFVVHWPTASRSLIHPEMGDSVLR